MKSDPQYPPTKSTKQIEATVAARFGGIASRPAQNGRLGSGGIGGPEARASITSAMCCRLRRTARPTRGRNNKPKYGRSNVTTA